MTGLTGSMVGPISGLTSSAAATLVDQGQGYDFAIGGLGFNLRITDDTPYERATAQFRKDQLDTSQNYGDQSLVGFWTRGQFSFHKGAGVNYYELSDGETVLNRFKSGVGVEPFIAGEVTLGRNVSLSPLTDVKYAAPTWDFSAGIYYAMLDSDGDLWSMWDQSYGAAATSVGFAGVGVGPARMLSGGPKNAYIARNKEVHSYAAGAASTTILWTLADEAYGAWYAKGRLWIVDDYGRWFMVSTAGGTLTAVDSDFTIPERGWLAQNTNGWSVCETPRSVLFAYGNEIYRVGVDFSGTSPTVTQPELAISLPTNETISHIGFHLGHLVIATNKGVRFALEEASDAGLFVYGPLVASGVDFSAVNSITSEGASVVIPGTGPHGFGMYHFSLSNLVSDLQPGWVVRDLISASLTPAYSGAFSSFFGIIAWANTAATLHRVSLSNLAASGTITTGLHRFGTMERKKFHSVRVRVGGAGGTVQVSKVLDTGSVVPLHTIDVEVSDSEEITLGLDDPVEAIGLQFTLTRKSAAVGPKLLGYQLRALPAPKRQRMIRVPLSLYDVERRGTTQARGWDGSAWERLRALEHMEEEGGTFVFQDFRTGEAGTCYIESIEHRGSTPPGRQSDGYGGVVFLTLRRL